MTWKRKEKTWYRCGHVLSTFISYLLYRPKIYGKNNIPKTGGVLIVPNHRAMLDIPILGCATFRPLRFMAKIDLFKNRFVKWYFETNGSFSVDKESGDPKAIKKAVNVLKDGDALVIFPEGKRNRGESVGELTPGVGFLASKTNVPIIPVGIAGLDKAITYKFGFIPILTRGKVYIGDPIDFYLDSDEKTSVVTKKIMDELEKQLPVLFEKAKSL
ncbi:MAG: lysophospholipid acyltransferase family protein [Acidimicrobiia bacterium]